METVLKAIADWIKGILTAGIMSNLSGLFDDVNTQVGNIAQQVGTKPSSFEPRVFAMIEALSRNVVLPIAGIILTFMMHFVELYHGEFSEERLLRALRSIHPVDIYRIGQDDPAKLRGWKKYVFPIYTAYNGKCRKDALPMKF